ncbi:hypothetical protein [Senegalimassilia anaerobia]|nr:hypothetical protein [Senegalimassilia anaerobia]
MSSSQKPYTHVWSSSLRQNDFGDDAVSVAGVVTPTNATRAVLPSASG